METDGKKEEDIGKMEAVETGKAAGKKKRPVVGKKGKKWIKRLIILAVIVAVVVTGARFAVKKAAEAFLNQGTQEANYTVEKVERRTIENHLSSSGTVKPLDTYSVTTVSSVEGTVLTAEFEEGDLVEAGQVLYQISTDSMDSKVDTAKKQVERAQKNYRKAQEEYEDAKKELNNLLISSDLTGYVKSIEVKEGGTIQSGNSRLIQVYNNKTMLLTVPFLTSDVGMVTVGKKASVELAETGEAVSGTVSKVSGVDEVLTGGRVVRYVTIEVANPGAITAGDTASASVGKIYGSEEGTFAVSVDDYVLADLSGEISTIYVKEGEWVEEGDPVLILSSESVDNQLEDLADKVESAQESVEDAQDNLEDVYDGKAEYTITSPITGTVIAKNTKAGDTISSSNMNSTLCLIYDLSAMTFDMYVDELDVMSVKEGQIVNITADALEGEEFTGVITNVSLVSTTSGGVTQYPVTVRIDETGNLLPGMNISGEIVIESSENTLAVPVNALQRGNVVYVQDDTVTEAQGQIPAGFRETEVTVGISSDEYIEILSGISEGDSIYVPGRSSGGDEMMPGMTMEMEPAMPGGSGGGGGNRGGNGGGGGRPGGGF